LAVWPENTDFRFALLSPVDASEVLVSRWLSVLDVAPSPSEVDSLPAAGVPVTQSFSVK